MSPVDSQVPTPNDEPSQSSSPITERQEADLADASVQEQYREEYLRQLRRRSCPGCGEGDAIY